MELKLSREPHELAWKLYQESFPKCERRSKERHEEILKLPNFMPYHIYENGEFIGFVYLWNWNTFYYGEHLATLPEVRGGGVGAKVLQELFKIIDGQMLILEIDPPITEIAKRRQKFYERLGIITTDHDFIHPSYQLPQDPHKLVIMSYPTAVSKVLFEEFKEKTLSVIL